MIALLFLAVALAMDAFAAALAQGAAGADNRRALAIAAAFGFAQGAMPLLGWGLGVTFAATIAAVDHWIALFILVFLGARMVREGLAGEAPAGKVRRLTGRALLAAAIATSVDAAAAGVTLPTIGVPIALSVAVIGGITFLLSLAAVRIGRAAGARLGKWAEIGGGLMLAGIGVNIFIQHQFFGG